MEALCDVRQLDEGVDEPGEVCDARVGTARGHPEDEGDEGSSVGAGEGGSRRSRRCSASRGLLSSEKGCRCGCCRSRRTEVRKETLDDRLKRLSICLWARRMSGMSERRGGGDLP